MFGKDGGAKYLRYECKPCARKQAQHVSNLKRTVFAPPENYKCPICNRNKQDIIKNNPNKKGIWCADHDHKSGKFRGWICHKCNLGLGNFSDDPERLDRAKQYLETNGQISRTTVQLHTLQ
jgi:hypothetical protein